MTPEEKVRDLDDLGRQALYHARQVEGVLRATSGLLNQQALDRLLNLVDLLKKQIGEAACVAHTGRTP